MRLIKTYTMNRLPIVDFIKSLRSILRSQPSLKGTSPPRFCISTRETRITIENKRGQKGGNYPW